MRSRIRTLLAVLAASATVAAGTALTRVARLGGARQPGASPAAGLEQLEHLRLQHHRGQVRQAADAMVNSGMRAAGYQYVVVDDCWQAPPATPLATCAPTRCDSRPA